MKYLALFFLMSFLFYSCSESIKDKKMTQSNIQKIGNSKELTENEKELLAAYLIRTNLKNGFSGIDSTMTIGEVIQKQKEWLIQDSIKTVEEQKAAELAFQKRQEQIQMLKNMVSVNIVKKSFLEGDLGDINGHIAFILSIHNNSDSTIIGVKGSLKISDIFGDEICTLEVKYDKELMPTERTFTPYFYDYNPLMDTDTKVRYTELGKMNIVWEPEMIIFDNGSKLVIDTN
jgi:ABC-type sugar transport system ATPase subunit